MSSNNVKLIHFEILKLRLLKLCEISSGLYGDSHAGGQLISMLEDNLYPHGIDEDVFEVQNCSIHSYLSLCQNVCCLDYNTL